jgi:hypothetical protein
VSKNNLPESFVLAHNKLECFYSLASYFGGDLPE